MNWISCFLFFILASGSCRAGALKVDVSLSNVEVRPKLELSLANASGRKISIYRNSLPWLDHPGSFTLKAFRVDAAMSELKVFGKLRGLIGDEELLPGDLRRGEIDLCSKVENLERESAKGEVVFLWVYIPKSPRESMGVYSGSFVLPKGGVCR